MPGETYSVTLVGNEEVLKGLQMLREVEAGAGAKAAKQTQDDAKQAQDLAKEINAKRAQATERAIALNQDLWDASARESKAFAGRVGEAFDHMEGQLKFTMRKMGKDLDETSSMYMGMATDVVGAVGGIAKAMAGDFSGLIGIAMDVGGQISDLFRRMEKEEESQRT